MLEHDRNAINESNDYREIFFCLYWYFLEINFQPKVCNDCFNENDNHYYYKVFFSEKCSFK